MDRALDRSPLPLPNILDMAEQAGERTGDLAALAAWLLSFAPDKGVEELAFLYADCRSYAQSALTIQTLDRILAQPDHDPWPAITGNAFLLVELIEWRLKQTPEHGAELQRLRARLLGAEDDTASASAGSAHAAAARPASGPGFTSLLRLAERAAVQVSELAALVSWLSAFAPVTALRELEAMAAITRGYRAAVFAIQDLDALLNRTWRSPREHVRGDLSMVLVLIDYRLARRTADRLRLKQVQTQILEAQRLEILAADRRRQMHEEQALPAGSGTLGGLFPNAM